MRITHSDVHYYMSTTGAVLDAWEVNSLVEMGDQFVRSLRDNKNIGLPKLDMARLDETLQEASRRP